jgi:hypothetical protein
MFFLPILIVAFRYFERFSSSSKNEARYHEEVSEINSFADGLLLDSEFLASLDFQNGTAKVYLEDLYASFKLTKPYYDLKYTHQCLGYFLVVKENDLYRIYTTDYCKM